MSAIELETLAKPIISEGAQIAGYIIFILAGTGLIAKEAIARTFKKKKK